MMIQRIRIPMRHWLSPSGPALVRRRDLMRSRTIILHRSKAKYRTNMVERQPTGLSPSGGQQLALQDSVDKGPALPSLRPARVTVRFMQPRNIEEILVCRFKWCCVVPSLSDLSVCRWRAERCHWSKLRRTHADEDERVNERRTS